MERLLSSPSRESARLSQVFPQHLKDLNAAAPEGLRTKAGMTIYCPLMKGVFLCQVSDVGFALCRGDSRACQTLLQPHTVRSSLACSLPLLGTTGFSLKSFYPSLLVGLQGVLTRTAVSKLFFIAAGSGGIRSHTLSLRCHFQMPAVFQHLINGSS